MFKPNKEDAVSSVRTNFTRKLYNLPSFFALAISGILILVTLIILVNQEIKLEGFNLLVFLLLLSSAIALHGQLHMQAEIHYNYNPMSRMMIY